MPGGAVQSLSLGGLGVAEARALLADKQLLGTREDWISLIDRLGGNGLALKVVGESIRAVFEGDIREFLEASRSAGVHGDIRRLLEGQLERASPLERRIISVLAGQRDPATATQLLRHLP